MNRIIHNMVVGNQSAYIEATYGEGHEKGIEWIGNGLFGPGHIPTKEMVGEKTAQEWFDENVLEYEC